MSGLIEKAKEIIQPGKKRDDTEVTGDHATTTAPTGTHVRLTCSIVETTTYTTRLLSPPLIMPMLPLMPSLQLMHPRLASQTLPRSRLEAFITA